MSSKGVSKMVSFLRKRYHFQSEHFAARMRLHSARLIFDFKYSLSPLCYFKEGKSVAQSNIVSKVKAASACMGQMFALKWYLFLRKDTILDTPLELTRRLAFARFMYHKQSKDTAACEGGGQLPSGGSRRALNSTSVGA